MPKARNMPDEFKAKNTKARVSGEDDVEGHTMRSRVAPDEFKAKISRTKVSGEDDVEGHWMPDANSSMRLAKARNSEVERGARQHQLESDARRAQADAKRTHTKG